MKKNIFYFILAGISYVLLIISFLVSINLSTSPILYNVNYRNNNKVVRLYKNGSVKIGDEEKVFIWITENGFGIAKPENVFPNEGATIDSYVIVKNNGLSLYFDKTKTEYKVEYNPRVIAWSTFAVFAITCGIFTFLGVKEIKALKK